MAYCERSLGEHSISNPFCKYMCSAICQGHTSAMAALLWNKNRSKLSPPSLSVIFPLLHWLHHWAESTLMAPSGTPACSWKSSDKGSVSVCACVCVCVRARLRQRQRIHLHLYDTQSRVCRCLCHWKKDGASGCSYYFMQVKSVPYSLKAFLTADNNT